MANFQRSDTIGDSANRQDLYDLIGNCDVKNLAAVDVIGLASVGITSSSSYPGAATAGIWWWDMNDQLFKMPVLDVDGTTTDFFCSVGPDAWDFPGYNICSYTIPRGTLLRWDYSAGGNPYGCTPMEPMVTFLTHGRDLRAHTQMRNAYGFAAWDMVPNGYGPVRTEGFGLVKAEWNSYYAQTSNVNNHSFYPLIPSTQYTGYVQATPNAGSPTWVTQVAAGIARPTTTGFSVCAPALIHLPAGRVGQLK